jgi:hypothetical protein
MASDDESSVRRLWQQQPGDGSQEQAMAMSEIRARAAQFESRTHTWNLVGAAVIVLAVIVEAWQVWAGEELLERTGDLLTIAAFFYIAHRYRTRQMPTTPESLGRTGSVEYYRDQLIRQRDLADDKWGYLLPFVPGVSLSLLGGAVQDRPAGQVVALAVFGIVLFLGIAWWVARGARALQKQIEALD